MGKSKEGEVESWERRVALNVSGKRLQASAATLIKSSYFQGMFDHAVPDEEVFIDADPAAFELLLRFMRRGVVNAALPENDPALCRTVLAEADFFGVDELLQAVKVAAWKNSQPAAWIKPQPPKTPSEMARLFDEEHSINEALDMGVLPERYWRRAERKVVSMVDASSTTWALIGFLHRLDGFEDWVGGGMETCDFVEAFDELKPYIVRKVLYFATMQEVDGTHSSQPEPMIELDPAYDLHDSFQALGRESLTMFRPGQHIVPLSDYARSYLMLRVVRYNKFDRDITDEQWVASNDIWARTVVADARPEELLA